MNHPSLQEHLGDAFESFKAAYQILIAAQYPFCKPVVGEPRDVQNS